MLLIILFLIYLFKCGVQISITKASVFSILLLVYIISGINHELLEYRYIKILNIAIFFLFFETGSSFFNKYKILSRNMLLITFGLFYVFGAAKLIFHNGTFTDFVEFHFTNTGLFSLYITLFMVGILCEYKEITLKRKNVLCIILLVITLFCILYMKSRLSIVIFITYIALGLLSKSRRATTKCFILAFIILAIIALALCVKRDSTLGRWFILKTSMRIISDNIIAGIGYGNFPIVYPKYQASQYQKGHVTIEESQLLDNTTVALNEFIQLLAELGVIGGVLFLFFVNSFYKYNPNSRKKLICISLAICMSYILHNNYISYLIVYQSLFLYTPTVFRLGEKTSSYILKISIFLAIGILCIYTYKAHVEDLAKKMWVVSPDKMNNFYDRNYQLLQDIPYFIFKLAKYNYCNNNLKMALLLLSHLDKNIVRNDIELLKAECYEKLYANALAEKHFLQSIAICPNRYINRYKLFRFYSKIGENFKATIVAKEILAMPPKVTSVHTIAIKNEIYNYLTKNGLPSRKESCNFEKKE